MVRIYINPKNKNPDIVFEEENRKISNWEVFRDFVFGWWGIPWIKRIFILFLIFATLKFWLFRWDDFKNGCHITIGLSLLEWNNLEIKKSLRYIREKSPSDYKNVCQYVNHISPDLPCGGSGGGCYHTDKPGQIEVSVIFHRKNSALNGAIIVHETCHSIQKEQGRPLGEKECYGEMNRFLSDVGVDSPWKDIK